MTQLIKIFIADDHQIFIDGIKALLNEANNIRVIGEANNGNQLLERLQNAEADILLLDIGMPGLNGIEAADTITKKYPLLKIIALTAYDNNSHIVKMMRAGAKGYILKNTSKNELLHAIETIANGNVYYSPEVTMTVMKKISDGKTDADPLSKLTKREIEIVKLISKSLTNKEIANQLFLSELTVNTHRKNAMHKLEIKNTAGLVKFAMDNGIVDI